MPRVLERTPEQSAWIDAHRCVICDGEVRSVKSTSVGEHIMLKPEYRHMAMVPGPYAPHMTDIVGGENRVDFECENGHLFTCYYDWVKDDA